MSNQDSLEHVGIPGMKWGRHTAKSSPTSTKSKPKPKTNSGLTTNPFGKGEYIGFGFGVRDHMANKVIKEVGKKKLKELSFSELAKGKSGVEKIVLMRAMKKVNVPEYYALKEGLKALFLPIPIALV